MALSPLYRHPNLFPEKDWRWPSFSPHEIACRGTGNIRIDTRSMDMLQKLRNHLGKPMIVNSGYRSPEHNRRVGGAKNSFHMKSMAFDVRMDNHDPHTFIEAAKQIGFRGIGTYPKQGFVHIDTRDYNARFGDPFPNRHNNYAIKEFAPEPNVKEEARTAATTESVAAVGVLVGAAGFLTHAAPSAAVIALPIIVAVVAFIFWKKRIKNDV